MTRRKKGQRLRARITHPRIGPTSERPIVTDHALLRYLERHYGFDTKKIVDEILGEGRAGIIYLTENGRVPIGDGLQLVVEGRRVVTVVPRRKQSSHGSA